MNQQAAASSNLFAELDATRRRLLYRSKQRGWLEMDIMLGGWAEKNLHHLDKTGLVQFHDILEMENPDLYKWLTNQEPVPAKVDNPLLRTLCAQLASDMAPKVSVASKGSFEGKVWE